MKKIIPILLFCITTFISSVYAEVNSADDIKIFVNDKELIPDVKPVMVNDRTLIPMRAIFEALGAEVSWNQDTRQATGTKGEYSITLTIDSDTAVINNKEEKIDAPAMLVSDRTMIPLRVTATALNSDVQWNDGTRTITVNDKTEKEKEYTEEKTIVFLGDSITAGGGYCKYILHYLTTRYPYTKINYFNAGISGTAAPPKNSNRLEWDVLADKPDTVFVLFGSNDLNYGPFWKTETEVNSETQNKINTCVERISGIVEVLEGTEVVLASPKMFDEHIMNGKAVEDNLKGKNETMRILGREIKKLAEKYDTKYADLWQCMNEVTDETRDKTGAELVLLTADRTHPNELGHFVMAYKYIVDLGMTDTVASVEIDVNEKNIKAENADAELVACDSEVVKYSYYPRSLPLANNSTYKESKEKLYGLNIADINKEIIKISGLDEGEYKVYAGDKVMLRTTAEELSSGVNIAECASNPGQKKAMASYKLLNTGCQFVQSLRSINPTENGIGIKEYYKLNFGNDYEKLLEAQKAEPDNGDIKKAVKYAETEQSMAEYIFNSQKILVPGEYTITIEKIQ